uniref:Transcription elongation factor 1 homolog n=1 Tax=Helianthus annuus TaxID=4232 RepID=A0A251UVV1_HELAN
MDKLDTVFSCPFCNHGTSVEYMLEDKDEEEEFVVDGLVDEGDVHIKPPYRSEMLKCSPPHQSNFLSTRSTYSCYEG